MADTDASFGKQPFGTSRFGGYPPLDSSRAVRTHGVWFNQSFEETDYRRHIHKSTPTYKRY